MWAQGLVVAGKITLKLPMASGVLLCSMSLEQESNKSSEVGVFTSFAVLFVVTCISTAGI